MALKSYRLKFKKKGKRKRKSTNLFGVGLGLVGLAIGLSAIKATQ